MTEHADFAPLVLKLLKGPLYYDDPIWGELLVLQRKTADYLSRIGLELVLSEAEGFAFITQKDGQEEENLPRLTPRRPLSFEVSLLAILLREELERFDPDKSDSLKVFISLSQIRDKLRVYFPDSGDEVRLIRDLDKHISVLERLKYIRPVSAELKSDDPRYEIQPIMKARVTPEFIDEFKSKLTGGEK
ncbi:DUF4194 domain-containing protein [Marispirochaeta sp.]|jgi:hypothetical protein|uniref:DUF4194 domain-containing protein n=1 Tax=Marispirochaeta sp. TaxID=2038653 RepID=UPI0029C75819|nr:DUF4194 domain-containing protein [Marispirochaeta sp.]